MSELAQPDFDHPQLADAVESLSPAEVDALPFGAIRLDAAGRVVYFSEAERRLAGYRKTTIGRDFFLEIAPCMNNTSFRGRLDRALATGRLDIAFSHIGDFDDATKELNVRIQSAHGGGCWIFMQRDA